MNFLVHLDSKALKNISSGKGGTDNALYVVI